MADLKQVWVVIQYNNDTSWQLQGIFNTQEDGVNACKDHDNYGLGPCTIGQLLPSNQTAWQGFYYPSKLET